MTHLPIPQNPSVRSRRIVRAGAAAVAALALTLTTAASPAAAATRPALRGSLDAVTASAGFLRIGGWSVDPVRTGDSNSEIIVVDNKMAALPVANQVRADVNRALRIKGSHGFRVTITAKPGSHRVCVIARPLPNTGGTDSILGCRTVLVGS